MADIVWSDVTDMASELLVGVTIGAQTKILAYVNSTVNPDAFKGDPSATFDLARIYLAAHYAALSKLGIFAVGPATSKSEGGASISFASLVGPGADPLLGSTSFGRAFLALVRSSPASVGFVV